MRREKGKPETARYRCDACEGAIEEHHHTAMLGQGEWRATTTSADPGTIGFRLSALYSPVGWLPWVEIARAWEAAQATDETKRSFKNSMLGETWMETGEAPVKAVRGGHSWFPVLDLNAFSAYLMDRADADPLRIAAAGTRLADGTNGGVRHSLLRIEPRGGRRFRA